MSRSRRKPARSVLHKRKKRRNPEEMPPLDETNYEGELHTPARKRQMRAVDYLAENQDRIRREGVKKLPKIDQPMKRREKRFADILVGMDGMITQTEAAVQAGYPLAGASSRASELLNPKKLPNVVKYIEEKRAERDQKYRVTKERHERDLFKIREAAMAEGKFGPAVSAEVARGKVAGLYIERKEVRSGSIEHMNKDELQEAMEKLQAELGRSTSHLDDEYIDGEVRMMPVEAIEAAGEAVDENPVSETQED